MRWLGRLIGNLWRILLWPAIIPWRLLRRTRGRWLFLRLSGSLIDFPLLTAWWRRFLPGWVSPQSTISLRRAFRRIAREGRISGVLVELWPLRAGWVTCGALRQTLQELAESGVQVVVYLPHGAGQRELFVAGAATRVLAAPHSELRSRGLSASRTYLGSLLRRAGVDVQVTAAGRFKTAGETLHRDRMSDNERAQLEALMGSLDRGLQRESLALPGDTRQLSAEQAVDAGVLWKIGYHDELHAMLQLPERAFPPTPVPQYAKGISGPTWRPLRRKPFVAVVPVHGPITHGVGIPTGPAVAFDPLVSALRGLGKDPRVQAVVLHIDSPGGSAANSDLLHREVQRLAAEKPVVAWLSNVAASGGYYIACAAHQIVADPMTLTGSIGVIGIKPVFRGLLGWAGVRVETVKTHASADMDSPARAYDEAEAALVRAEVERLYARFVDVVAEGRELSTDRVHELAAGRVYSGADAAEVGLIDRLGGEPAVVETLQELVDARMARPTKLGELQPLSLSRGGGPPPLPPRALGDDESVRQCLQLWSQAGERALYFATELPVFR